jgi:hypothetical protein
MLASFLELADAPDSQIADYAKRWGALLICSHGIPCTHGRSLPLPGLFGAANIEAPSASTGTCYSLSDKKGCFEPLAAWRSFSRTARAILEIAASLYLRDGGPGTAWKTVLGFDPYRRATRDPRNPDRLFMTSDPYDPVWGRGIPHPKPGVGKIPMLVVDGSKHETTWVKPGDFGTPTIENLGVLLAFVIDSFVASSTRLRFTWNSGAPRLAIETDSLYGAFALDIASAAARAASFAFCSGRGELFTPTRKPAEGRRRYCPTCTDDGVPVRDAQRDSRRRRRNASRARDDR